MTRTMTHNGTRPRKLLSDQLDGWHGIFMSPTDWTLVVRCLWVSAIFAAVPLALAYVSFGRRDVAGE